MDSEQLTAIADDLDEALTADASVGDLAAIAAGIPDAVFQCSGWSATPIPAAVDGLRGR
jgi:hypothetical protein